MKYELNHKVMRVIVNLNFNPDLHFLVKVNGMTYNYDFHRDWKYFINKQKKRRDVYVVLIYPIVFQKIFCKIEEESNKDIIALSSNDERIEVIVPKK